MSSDAPDFLALTERWLATNRAKLQSLGIEAVLNRTPSDRIKPAVWLDLSSAHAVGQATVWSSGECDVNVLDRETRGDRLNHHYELVSSSDLDQAMAAVLRALA